MKKVLAIGVCLIATILMGGIAYGAEVSAHLPVTAVVAPVCTVTTDPVDFGVYIGEEIDAVGAVIVTCTLNTPYTVKLGTGWATTFIPRAMFYGANRLEYNLYVDAARTMIWGDASPGTHFVTATGTAVPVSHPVYARLFADQTVPAGGYTDVVLVTVTY